MTRPQRTTSLVQTRALCRDYGKGEATVHALRNVTVEVPRGRLVAVQGPSGSGKTSLLNIIGGLDRPTSGQVLLDGADLTVMDTDQLLRLRRDTIGFVFQAFGLLAVLSAAENIEIPLRLARLEPARRRRRVKELLAAVGLSHRANHRPHELSGGEQQRVAIARALAGDPDLLIADEPTGQLDSRTARTIMTLIRQVVEEHSVTAIVATHDPALIDIADHLISLRDGLVTAAAPRETVLGT